jgi:transcriptional regulator with XRE-family HTH domain
MNTGYMSNKTVEFGRLCRSYRAKLGINMDKAAEKIEVTQSTITKIEQGEQPASFDYIQKSIATYKIRNRNEQMEFLLSYLKSGKKLDIPLAQFGPIRKECLAAICTLWDVDKGNPEGWDDLLLWLKGLEGRLNKPTYVNTAGGSDPL